MKRFLILTLMFVLLASGVVWAQEVSGPVFVSDPVVPSLTPAIRDLPTFVPDPNLFGLEAKRRDDHGIIVPDIDMPPHFNPLAEMQSLAPAPLPSAFGTPFVNFAGVTSTSSPPDDTGDVGPNHFVQGDNGPGGSRVTIFNKTGTQQAQFLMETLGSSPCNSGYCDPVVQYDQLADRWMISEFDSSANVLCVYVSRTSDPLGQWWAYSFNMSSQGGMQDYPKYGVWPDGYYIGVNNGGYIHVLDRVKMLSGLAATSQSFLITTLSGFSFQLTLPATVEGVAPPAGAPGIFARPVDTEIHTGYSCTSEPCDVMDLWAVHVDWTTPASSTLTHLPGVKVDEFDQTLCGTGSTWNCMPQPGTTQKIDPIREPIHFPLQYRNWGTYETLVGAFVEDVDGTDHAAVHWFELRKVSGTWSRYQEGVLGGEAGVHRSVAGAAMDGSGNIAVGYTRTGTTAPYYPSIYYSGRLATDPLGTMPYYDNMIYNATNSNTDNERWGDYAGIGVDPSDDCSFWFTTEYGGGGQTRIAAFKFDACGCLSVPAAPVATISAPSANRIDVGWNDSATASITQYFVYRSLTAGGPYALLATVPDSSPGVGGGASYVYHDDTVSGGTTYYYTIKSNDGVACTSPASNEVSIAATGLCTLPPNFAGITSVTNSALATCTLSLSWSAGSPACAGPLRYNIYRSTATGFTPSPANRIASGFSATTYVDVDQLVSGTTFYYVVRALDLSNSVEETNTTERSGTPTGPASTSTLTETFEAAGGFDLAGWTHSALSGATDWVWSTARSQTPTHSWFSASLGSASDRVLKSPSFGVLPTTTMTFYHTYAFEGSVSTCYDGGTLEVSTDGGTNWTVIPDAAITSGGFTGTVNTGFSNPIGGKRAFCAGTLGTMTQVSVNLGGTYNGLTIKVRWHEGDDSSTAASGWYVDSVTINNAGTASACATGTGCTPPGAPTLVSATGTCAGVNLSWTAGTGTTLSYNIYRSTTSGSGFSKLPASPVTGTSFSDSTATAGSTYYYVIKGCCDAGGISESATSNEKTAARLATPATPVAGNDGPVCAGLTLHLTASTVAGATYAWTGPNGFASSAQNPSIANATTAASGIYSVTAAVGGCTSSAGTTTAAVTVCAPNVQYDGTYNPVTSLTEICGNHNAVVEPGEKWRATVRLVNVGTGTANNTVASLTVNSGSVVLATVVSANPASYGTIVAGNTATANYEFVVSSGAVCVNNLTFDVTGIQSAEGSYPSTVPAFNVQVGLSTTVTETGTQVTPLSATNSTTSSNFGPAFTLSSPTTATVSYASAYTPSGGGTATLFGPDDMTSLSNWITSGSVTVQTVAHCTTMNTSYARLLSSSGSTSSMSKASAVSTVGYDNIHVSFACAVNNTNGSPSLKMDWSTNGTTWTNAFTYTASNTAWSCAQDIALPAGAAGQAGFKIRFSFTQTGNPSRYGYVDYVRITGVTPGSGSWTANARVSLVDPGNVVTVLKAYGAVNATPYNVLPYFTGPGTYQIRLEENIGGTATLTTGSMPVSKTTLQCTTASCGLIGEVAPGATSSTAQSWTDKTTQNWPATATATSYTLYRGIKSDLPQLLNSSTDSCTKYTGAANSTATITENPTGIAGGFYWYLVTGTNTGGEGPAGNATVGPRTVNSSGVCSP